MQYKQCVSVAGHTTESLALDAWETFLSALPVPLSGSPVLRAGAGPPVSVSRVRARIALVPGPSQVG